MQFQDLVEDSDIVAIEEAETETKSNDLEVSNIDKIDVDRYSYLWDDIILFKTVQFSFKENIDFNWTL